MDLKEELETLGVRKIFYLKKLMEFSTTQLSDLLNTGQGNTYKAFSCHRCTICLKHREMLEVALKQMKGGSRK